MAKKYQHIKPEDEKNIYSIWKKSNQDSSALGIICELFMAEAREVRRVIDSQRLKDIQRIRENTLANEKLYG